MVKVLFTFNVPVVISFVLNVGMVELVFTFSKFVLTLPELLIFAELIAVVLMFDVVIFVVFRLLIMAPGVINVLVLIFVFTKFEIFP